MNQHELIRVHRNNGWLLAVTAGLLCAATVQAQSGSGYELKNGAFTSGTGIATNGPYRMSGAFKPSVGAATNGAYSLAGTFASVGLVQTSGAPLLKIAGSGAGFVLSWTDPSTGFKLQATPALVSPNWTDVAQPVVVVGNDKTVTVPAAGPDQFFRLLKP